MSSLADQSLPPVIVSHTSDPKAEKARKPTITGRYVRVVFKKGGLSFETDNRPRPAPPRTVMRTPVTAMRSIKSIPFKDATVDALTSSGWAMMLKTSVIPTVRAIQIPERTAIAPATFLVVFCQDIIIHLIRFNIARNIKI